MPGEGAQKAKRGEWIGYLFLFLLPFPYLLFLCAGRLITDILTLHHLVFRINWSK